MHFSTLKHIRLGSSLLLSIISNASTLLLHSFGKLARTLLAKILILSDLGNLDSFSRSK
jgi:hypothetical protein